MNIEDLVARNKGPLIAFGGAGGGLVVLIIISAIVNMPSDINLGQIVVNVIWLIFIGGLLVAGFLYARERFDGRYLETEEDTLQDLEEILVSLNPATNNRPPSRPVIGDEKKRLVELFGTTDIDQITGSVKAMYNELEGLRNSSNQDGPDDDEKIAELTSLITALTNERDQAQTVSQKWQNKAISSTQEVELLRQEIKEHGKWQIVPEEELTDFFPTISLGDGEEPFLSSSRRQRRLMQRLSAEGYSIVKRQSPDS